MGPKNNHNWCTCPTCGYSTPHDQGSPCRNSLCPVCRVPLARGEKPTGTTTEAASFKTTRKDSPSVNSELCICCGSCIDVCPKGAIITTDDGKAFIDENRCAACRVCEKICPVGAIS
ncbi:ATP-binding protein [Gaoshiqia sediminis]|uniref:4Fe-4S binding protein n=1 Tax=Gaoshiqia sediminis TaxID=2986998 RepID=A0AA41Y7K9_9BACT|nr:4Fe-4S binding protein [Gaoshiqia sediminis]MCW0484911.1 4Fe-4S binding protein [Gaoshiqia sediminis]